MPHSCIQIFRYFQLNYDSNISGFAAHLRLRDPNATFGTVQINQLCSALVNFTQGYPRNAIACYITPSGVNPYAGLDVMVTGFMQWQNFAGMTAQDKVSAVASRDAAEYYLHNNAVGSLNTTFPGIMVDCSCNPFYKATVGGQTLPIPGVPLATCSVEAKTGAASTVNEVGLDNGKVCPTGPQYIIPFEDFTLNPNLAGTGAGIFCQHNSLGSYTCRVNVATGVSGGLYNMMVGQRISFLFFSSGGQLVSSSCTPDEDQYNLDAFFYFSAITAVDTSNINDQRFVEFTVPLRCTNSADVVVEYNSSNSILQLGGLWSPSCDSDFAFYKAA